MQCVDDLLIVSKNPEFIVHQLKHTHKFKLKGTGEISFHLGCNFYRDNDGTLCYAPKIHIQKMVNNYKRLFGCKPTVVQ